MKALNKQDKEVLQMMGRAKFDDSLREVDGQLTLNGIFSPESVEFRFRSGHDKKNPHRPYIAFYGYINEVESFLNGDKLPYDIGVADMSHSPIEMTYLYEFDDNELKELVDLGMFNPNFKFPSEKIEGKILELGVNAKCYYIDENQTEHVPVLILDVDTLSNIVIRKESLPTTNILSVFDAVEREEESELTFEDAFEYETETELEEFEEETVLEEEDSVTITIEPVIEVTPYDNKIAMSVEEAEKASINAIKNEQLGMSAADDVAIDEHLNYDGIETIVTHAKPAVTKNRIMVSSQSHTDRVEDEYDPMDIDNQL